MLLKQTMPIAISAAVLAVACGGGGVQPAATTQADLAPINAVRTAFQTAYNAGDAAALAALYTDDAISLPDHHEAIQGKAAIQRYYEDEIFKQYTVTIAIMPGDTEINGNLAHEHGTYTIAVTPRAGGDKMTDDGKYVVILKRGADGVWRIHHDIDNSKRLPGQAAPRG
jgi:uncharacterized protein (TIGR02246 family)